MGLDMYLDAEWYVENWDHDEIRTKVSVQRTDKTTGDERPLVAFNPDKVKRVVEEVAYWRKVNAVHNWFVQNCGDGKDECQPIYVEVGDLKRLVEICESVLADHDLAPTVLPTTSGFFFGGVEYDDWYFEGLKQTVDQLVPILKDVEGHADIADQLETKTVNGMEVITVDTISSKDYKAYPSFIYQASW